MLSAGSFSELIMITALGGNLSFGGIDPCESGCSCDSCSLLWPWGTLWVCFWFEGHVAVTVTGNGNSNLSNTCHSVSVYVNLMFEMSKEKQAAKRCLHTYVRESSASVLGVPLLNFCSWFFVLNLCSSGRNKRPWISLLWEWNMLLALCNGGSLDSLKRKQKDPQPNIKSHPSKNVPQIIWPFFKLWILLCRCLLLLTCWMLELKWNIPCSL